jgi:hypothetical protein
MYLLPVDSINGAREGICADNPAKKNSAINQFSDQNKFVRENNLENQNQQPQRQFATTQENFKNSVNHDENQNTF